MAKYMITGNYTAEGAKGLLQEGGSGRRKAVEELMSSVGGSVESFYYAFGSDDVFVIVDAPDDEAMVAGALTASSTGMVGVETKVLLTPEQIDAAVQRSPAYRPPGS